MKDKRRLVLGSLFFASLFFYVFVHFYFAFIFTGSSDGWFGRQNAPGEPIYITGTEPGGPATALQAGDEFLAINGVTPAEDPAIINYCRRVPPGTRYTMTIRRNGEVMDIPLVTVPRPASQNFGQRVSIIIHLFFLLTGLAVFLLKPDNEQAWLLALMLGTFIGLSTWEMPLEAWGMWAHLIISLIKILCLFFLPLFVHFFLKFPEPSPLLRRWPKLERYLYLPFLLVIMPYLGAGRMPPVARQWYFTLPPIKWLNEHNWFGLPMPLVVVYLTAGLIALIINYRVANRDARRRLRVVMAGSGGGFFLFLLVVGAEFLGLYRRIPGLNEWLELGMFIALPLIPLSFTYAIIRHKVIPISLIIRRSARYLLVSRGSAVLVIAGVCVIMFFLVDALFRYMRPVSGRMVGIISAVLAIAVWNLSYSFHRRVIAPQIDRRFFRESYDARQILSELASAVRSATDNRQLLEMVCARIQKALHVESVTVFLRDEARGDYAQAISLEHRPQGSPEVSSSGDLRLPAEACVIELLSASGEPLPVDLQDPRSQLALRLARNESESSAEKEALATLRSTLLLPLAGKEGLLGLISLGPRLGDQPFSREDGQMLMSVVGQTTFALENIRLIERMLEEERRRRELEAENELRAKELEEARQLQLSMLPKRVPQLPGIEIAAYMKTATEVGGDYYDFHLSDDGTLTVAIGDATGHGMKAGTMVTAVKGLFEAFAQQPDIIRIFEQTSTALKRMNLRSLFMAMTIIKLKGDRLTVSSAGMPPLLIYRAASGEIEEVAIRGMPLGSLTNYPYKQQELSISPGDVLALMSDGLPERFNFDNEMLDYASTRRAFASAANESPEAIIEHFVETGEAWAGGRPQDDDVTFVVLKVKNGAHPM